MGGLPIRLPANPDGHCSLCVALQVKCPVMPNTLHFGKFSDSFSLSCFVACFLCQGGTEMCLLKQMCAPRTALSVAQAHAR